MQRVFINNISWKYIFSYFSKNRISLFRHYQNLALRDCSSYFKGLVIELGGEKSYSYKDIFNGAEKYIVSNIDRDYDEYIDVTKIEKPDASVDNYVMVSALQHVDKPHIAIDEITRTIKQGGYLVLINAFTHPICDTYDYWRFSEDAYYKMLNENFEVVKVYKLGGKFACFVNTFQRPRSSRKPRALINKIIGFFLAIAGKFLEVEDMSPLGIGVLVRRK